MGKRYLLDTNAVIDFLGNKLPVDALKQISKVIDTEINLSVINKIELLGFNRVESSIYDFVAYANILVLDEDITDLTISLRKEYRIKLPDAIIAATAIHHNMTLITNNIQDFRMIKDLKLLNPYSL
jgi:predicted nucleic acid-binding protein